MVVGTPTASQGYDDNAPRNLKPWTAKARNSFLLKLYNSSPLQARRESSLRRASSCNLLAAGAPFAERRLRRRRAQARRGALPGQDLTHLFSSGRGLCNARGLRVSGGGADQIRDPATGQSGSAGQDRLSAHAPSRTTSAPCAPVPCQFQLSGPNLDQAAEGYRQGRGTSPGLSGRDPGP